MDETFVKAIEDLHSRAATHERIEDGVPYAIVPNDQCVRTLEEYLPNPTRVRATRTFISLESFNRYVNQVKSKDEETRIEVRAGGSARAVIDASLPNSPQWEQHIAEFHLTYSDQWKVWNARDKQSFDQRKFAEFVEDNLKDFMAPAGADMLDIARTLQAEQNSQFSSAIRLENGDVQFGYTKTTVGKAGQKGEVEIPSQFTINVPILENENPRQVPVRLRYDLNDGKLTLTYEIIRKDALLQEVRRSIYAIIANETKIEPFLVA